jgi:hypothetical protein
MPDRRLTVWLVACAAVAIPAVGLRLGCAGASCPPPPPPAAPVAFCGLSPAHRDLVGAGYREGRSPEVMASTRSGSVLSDPVGGIEVPWPSTDAGATRVPIVFTGPAVRAGPLPAGTGLDAVAPTLAAALGFARPFPEVRSGRPLAIAPEGNAPLVVIIVWSGVGTTDLERAPDAWPALARELEGGAGTLEATTGSLPVDPAAQTATIGVGAVPAQHGVTGTVVRADDGAIRPAAGPGSPVPVLATLAEDLDQAWDLDARVGLVGSRATDRALIGGSWYVEDDRDDVVLRPGDPTAGVQRLLGAGYGATGPPDLLGVVLHGRVPAMDAWTDGILDEVRRSRPDAVIAIAGTGSLAAGEPEMQGPDVRAWVRDAVGVDVTEAVGAGIFLDAEASAAAGVGADRVATLLREHPPGPGAPSIEDVYPGFAVTLGRYC